MIKKILAWTSLIIIIIAVSFVVALLIFEVGRPNNKQIVQSITYDHKYENSAKLANTTLEAIYEELDLPSLSAAVGIDGKLVWAGAIGFADLDKAIPADTSTVYRIGSVSKSLTATAFMKLSEKGDIKLDDHLSVVVEDFSIQDGITMKHLLVHQSGIRHYSPITEWFSNKGYRDTRSAASIVEKDPLLFSPGTRKEYSTFGYTVLSLAMETITSKSLEDILTVEIFSPLGMDSTRLDKPGSDNNTTVASKYISILNTQIPAPTVDLSNKYAGGGILSTPTDLVTFANALINLEIVTESSRRLMWEPIPLNNPAESPSVYGVGFKIYDYNNESFVYHGGSAVGGYSFLYIDPVKSMVIAISSNTFELIPHYRYSNYIQVKKISEIFSK